MRLRAPQSRFSQVRPRRLLARLGAVALAMLALHGCRSEAVSELPMLSVNIAEPSVSGISSGAYMAGQFQLAHGSIVVGAGIIAGGPYGCAESLFADMLPGPGSAMLNATKAINGCMLNAMQLWGVPNTRMLAEHAFILSGRNLIDPMPAVTAVKLAVITVDAPGASGPTFAQFSAPSLLLSIEAGTEET